MGDVSSGVAIVCIDSPRAPPQQSPLLQPPPVFRFLRTAPVKFDQAHVLPHARLPSTSTIPRPITRKIESVSELYLKEPAIKNSSFSTYQSTRRKRDRLHAQLPRPPPRPPRGPWRERHRLRPPDQPQSSPRAAAVVRPGRDQNQRYMHSDEQQVQLTWPRCPGLPGGL
ncbi:hypothetical protein CI238_08182 [Colletotrichum incanum]|uniref:Uncharacterized protein n=1 Tax=Colletotrichum incanum TaxID=1573173 RepID=A0A161WGY1_COLIC|nr:hypothetical protein CI238_08182 [Colletotrichum incanum]